MNGLYGAAYTQGLQQYTGTERFVQAVVTLKHWLAYSIEGQQRAAGLGRHDVDVAVSAYDLAHTYMPPFETAVKQGKALGVMCSCECAARSSSLHACEQRRLSPCPLTDNQLDFSFAVCGSSRQTMLSTDSQPAPTPR